MSQLSFDVSDKNASVSFSRLSCIQTLMIVCSFNQKLISRAKWIMTTAG